jgi:two-component sensor histidine kinase
MAVNEAIAPETEALPSQGLLRHAQSNARLILGLLALQADRAGDPETRREMGGLVAQALGTAHERLDRAGVTTVGLAAYLRELCDHLARFHLGLGIDLRLTVAADAVAMAASDAVTLGLIVNELVADAAERALPGGQNEIHVELQAATRAGEARLTVTDNGRSLPDERHKELGLGFAGGLAAQLGAELAIIPSPRQGVQAMVAFPLPAP